MKMPTKIEPQFPIYVVSKGRWDNQLTGRALDVIGGPYRMIVEEGEEEQYEAERGSSCIEFLVTPQKYKDEYDMYWVDDDPRLGPGASRNFAWEHSMSMGFSHHWVMDDNFDGFHRLNRNIKAQAHTGAIFRAMEDFVLRYDNIAISGPNYSGFCNKAEALPRYVKNTRIYSCLFIRNDIPYRWRGRYNEDTDICLRVLKDGWATLQFNAFLADKITTQRMHGGNHQQFYSKDGTIQKSRMLEDMHPDVAKVVMRYGRWHHEVDYKPFKGNPLMLKEGLNIQKGNDEYGMILQKRKKESRAFNRHRVTVDKDMTTLVATGDEAYTSRFKSV